GEKLEFDRNGNWTEIDCKKSRVPVALVPSAIKNYVRKNYSGATIVQIEKARSGYEVQLSTGLELTFNKNFKVIDIDT
ncbi:PepSY-like domain-containing protein, partial [Sodaliphilus pleomorphus]|uniref:PepSY-like domain-containing protein n=1 Tax=Sodaliphilus pleomorphus TaxID=2606626 RepID=UPI00240950A8